MKHQKAVQNCVDVIIINDLYTVQQKKCIKNIMYTLHYGPQCAGCSRSMVPPTAILCEYHFCHILEQLLLNLNLHLYVSVCNNNKKITLNWINETRYQQESAEKLLFQLLLKPKLSKSLTEFAKIDMEGCKLN